MSNTYKPTYYGTGVPLIGVVIRGQCLVCGVETRQSLDLSGGGCAHYCAGHLPPRKRTAAGKEHDHV